MISFIAFEDRVTPLQCVGEGPGEGLEKHVRTITANPNRQAAFLQSRRNALRSYLGAYGFMAPAGVLVLIFFLIPVAIVLYLSVTNLASSNFTSDLAKMEFIGLEKL